MYNISIYPECKNEEECIALITALSQLIDEPESNFIVKPVRKTQINVPAWAAISRVTESCSEYR